jgi:hypothetical protein
MGQKTGIFATLAIIAAVASFFLTFSGHRILALVLAVFSIPLGALGVIMAASPRVGGGLVSIIAIGLGVFAAGVAVLGMIGGVFF